MPKNEVKLNEIQQKAVTHKEGPLLIAAGAGSGKTRTLTSRLNHLLESGIKPENIIAITFTNKAAKEMLSRVSKNKPLGFKLPFIGTFHSLGVRILKREARQVGRTHAFTIFDEDDSLALIKKILKEGSYKKDRYKPMEVIKKISRIKNELMSSDELEDSNYDDVIISIYKKYEDELKQSNAFDFDDLIEKVVRIFKNYSEILKKYQNQWQYILVDEFQDVNTSQYELVKLISEKHKNLFVIGDDQQSIYAFRGSDFKIFLNFERDWPNAKIIKLEENYRSTKNIIRAASELIKNNQFQKPKDLWTQNEEGSSINIFAYQNKDEEAWGIAGKIADMIRQDILLKDIAIVYRTNAQSRAIEQALIRMHIPYEIYGGLKFYARKEIKDIVASLRYAFNNKDAASVERLKKSLGMRKSEPILKDLPRLAETLSLPELINFFIENTDYIELLEKKFKNPEERRDNIKELIDFASSFKDPHEFLEQVSLMSSLDGRPKLEKESIKLMTIHLAKGLEFEHVFIIGVADGLLPHERSFMKNEDMEEERRLMYVAMTRAKQNLNLSFYDLPSRFLGELPPELIEFKQISSYGEEDKDWDDESIYIE
ncbi:UvrD-helicase domain-containing protein [Candidatus Wolfebacteria bacterium]|nr:UvrD-helicase domain-containing protein [Candidatus Wolfebacteria bacterium]